MATISVIIPCYNAAAYVGAAVRSVQIQRPMPHRVHEVILVDDGCTDDSVAVARTADASITVIRQPNGGISAARNTGVLASSGEWLAFLDADDLWPPHSLSSRATLLGSRDDLAGAAGSIEQFVSPDVPEHEQATIRLPVGAMPGRLAGALLLRRALFTTVGLFSAELAVGETLDWVARAETAGHLIGFVPDVVLRRRIHRNNSVQKCERLKADYLQVLRDTIQARRANGATTTRQVP